MSIYRPSTFTLLQSGDPVRVTLKDGVTTIEGSFRRFLTIENTLIVTQPIGEDDPALQTSTIYIDDYQKIESPIPAEVSLNLDDFDPGDSVEARWAAGGNGSVTGTYIAGDPRSGIVEIDDGSDRWILNNYWYIKKI